MRLIRRMMMGRLTRATPTARKPGFLKVSSMTWNLGGCLQAGAMVQELGEHGVEIVAGADEDIVDPLPGAAAPHLVEIFMQRLQVATTERPWIAEQVRQLFH